MATVTLQIGTDNITIDPANFNLRDLSQADSDLPFILDGQLSAFLDQPLSAVKDGSLTTITLDTGTPSWKNLAGSPATFSLQAKASASIKIQSTGALFTYFVDFAQTQSEKASGKAGAVYLITEFSFNISGKLSASSPVGSIGVTATADAQAATSYTVRNYKAFSPNETLKSAILKALAGFTLPLHEGTVDNLSDGDAIYYMLDGSIDVGFGATYGISASVGGYNIGEINSTFQKISKMADISAAKTMTVDAQAGLSLKFNWSRTFEFFLERFKPDAGPGSAKLHVSAGKTSQRSLTLSADGGITQISAPQVTVDTDTVTNWIVQKVGGTAAAGSSVFQSSQAAIGDEAQKYVSDANNWLSSLAQRIQSNGSVSLALVFQNTAQFTSAFTWNFDLGNGQFAQAWKDAVAGDFVSALSTGAATLESGSGYEDLHTRNTSIKLSLFGLAQFASLETYFSKSTLRYGGNGTFYVETSAGKVQTSSSKSRSSSTSIYLDGTAAAVAGPGLPATNVQIRIHGIVTSNGDKTQFARLGNLVQGLAIAFPGAASQIIPLGTILKSFSGQSAGTAMLHMICDVPALQRIRSDEYVNGNQPPPPHLLDEQNWNAFASASDKIPSDPAAYLATWLPTNPFYKTYASWAAFNCLVNHFIDADGNPTPLVKTDRQKPGNYQANLLRGYFGSALSDTTCGQLNSYFGSGQQFMNLCDDLHMLFDEVSSGHALSWTSITQTIEQIAGNDIDAWYGPVTLLALANCVQPASATVQQGKIDPSESSVTAVIAVA